MKIRGFRIELGEIENTMKTSDVLREVAVIDLDNDKGVKRLAAYIVPKEPGAEIDIGALRAILKAASYTV